MHALAYQVSKVSQKARMEAELTSLDSQLERAKLAHAARCSRLEAGRMSEIEASPLSKRVLFPDETGRGTSHPTFDPDLQAGKMDQWTPQLDLSQETKVSNSIALQLFRLVGVLVLLRGRSCWVLLPLNMR